MVSIKNFTSYKDLEVSFDNQGLTLISGENGSGKSTLCDVLPWVLYGKTSKAVSTTDVVSWGASEPTEGQVTIGEMTIYRARGLKPKDNDLYFTINGADPVRGKDITDTQKLIDERLGCNYQAFVLSCYIHEFSVANTFFSANAKQRKDILDQLIDLTELERVRKLVDLDRKTTGKSLEQALNMYSQQEYKSRYLEEQKAKSANQAALQDKKKSQLRAEIAKKERPFNEEIALIQEALKELQGEACSACGAPANVKEVMQLKEALSDIRAEQAQVQHLKYTFQELKKAPPVFDDKELETTAAKEVELKAKTEELSLELSDYETLLQLLKTCRAELIGSAVQRLQDGTNEMLRNFFEAELAVSLLVDVTEDKIEVMIKNNDYDCDYQQLSKGQRQMLKLCFSLTAMREVQMAKGLQPKAIYLDEAFDGMSETTKAKAFRALKSLETQYSSIFVVEHSVELKACFDNVWEVTMSNGRSILHGKT